MCVRDNSDDKAPRGAKRETTHKVARLVRVLDLDDFPRDGPRTGLTPSSSSSSAAAAPSCSCCYYFLKANQVGSEDAPPDSGSGPPPRAVFGGEIAPVEQTGRDVHGLVSAEGGADRFASDGRERGKVFVAEVGML